MAFCRILFPLLVLSVVQTFDAVQVPVLMWGDISQKSVKYSAISTVPFDEFRVIVKQELEDDPFTVVFVEETLSVEDFSRKVDGASSFPYLQANIDDAVYLPKVESPLRVLNKLADPEKVDHVRLTDSGLSADINRKGGKFLFVNLKDAKEGESREELLRRHNDFMEDMLTKLQEKYDKIVAVYTAHNPSWTVTEHSRVRREAEGTTTVASNGNVTDLIFSNFRIYFQKVLFRHTLETNSSEKILTGATVGTNNLNGTFLESAVNFEGGATVTLNFENKGGYWLLNNAVYKDSSMEQALYASEDIYALLGYSYRCAPNITLTTKYNRTMPTNYYTVTFQNSRMQPFFNENSTDVAFGEMFNCVGFFTVPIWAGIMVVSMLLAITFYGIMMMLDIRTMDRFDDPKGKTITINASD